MNIDNNERTVDHIIDGCLNSHEAASLARQCETVRELCWQLREAWMHCDGRQTKRIAVREAHDRLCEAMAHLEEEWNK